MILSCWNIKQVVKVMPIRLENRHRYPKNWSEIRTVILERAANRCESCHVPNYAVGFRSANGRFHPLCGNGPCDAAGQGLKWPSYMPISYRESREFAHAQNDSDGTDSDGNRWIVIVLTIAHINDRSPENCTPENLQALCQRCHLLLDQYQHRLNAQLTRRAAKACEDLFGYG